MKTTTKLISFILITCFFVACEEVPIPKPLGYYRIDFPEKQYINYEGSCPFTFKYPLRSLLDTAINGKPDCWMNLHYPQYGATVHFTYSVVDGNLNKFIEDSRKLVMKHIVKANDIVEEVIIRDEHNVYGLTYDFEGNTATNYQFFITDSSKHFVRGSMYFNLPPNPDSLAPVNDYIKADLKKMITSFQWKEE